MPGQTRPQYSKFSNGTQLDRNAPSQGVKRKRESSSKHPKPSQSTDRISRLTEKQRALCHARARLPIATETIKIKASLSGNFHILLLVGETGSGKSTQVPQYLLDEPWCEQYTPAGKNRNRNDSSSTQRPKGGCIAITQPRRVAAISLARRVADEMFTTLGSSSPASKVGYSVRFDNNVAPATRIKFLTEGMLLQEMLRDPSLEQYSAVVVDEVHERSVNVDLILGFLRNIASNPKVTRKGAPLKVIIMSATADTQALFDFFESAMPQSEIAQKARQMLADTEESHKALPDRVVEDLKPKKKGEKINVKDLLPFPPAAPGTLNVYSEHVSTCFVEGRQHEVKVTYLEQPTQDYVQAALKAIFTLHLKEPLPGDILVFLPGQDNIEALEKMVDECAAIMDRELPKILTLPLFAALPREAQQAVFQPTPARTRKVILSTNIAETSVTIPGVRFVVDTGLAKVKEYRSALGLDSLLVKPISKSSATQRKGRAGREAAGKCFRLYSERDYLALPQDNIPEILRCDLAAALLTMKARGVADVLAFPFLTSPAPDALRRALFSLHRLGALDDDGNITPEGSTMARLPLSPSLARILIAAAKPEADVVLEAIDIIAALSVEAVFLQLNTDDAKEAATSARRDLYRREGDHLTLLRCVQAYVAENTDRRSWCTSRAISHRAMKNVMDVRKQLTAQSKAAGLLSQSAETEAPILSTEKASVLLRCVLTGFVANCAHLAKDGSYRTNEGRNLVAIHPSSVLFGKKVEAICYNELNYTNKTWARGVSAIQMDWWAEAVGV